MRVRRAKTAKSSNTLVVCVRAESIVMRAVTQHACCGKHIVQQSKYGQHKVNIKNFVKAALTCEVCSYTK
jgi:hypothetical protein